MPFSATKNLVAALRHVRHGFASVNSMSHFKELPNRFWVDAICVNQNDIPERNAQVQLMRSIYRDAALVLSWLGLTNDTMRIALQAIKTIHSKVELMGRKVTSLEPLLKHDILLVEDTEEGFLPNAAWSAIQHLFNLDYWDRIWIVQEVTLARENYMLVGNDILDIYQLGNLQLLLNAIQSGRWHNPGFARSVWNALLVSDVISIGTFSLIIRLKLALLKPTRALSPLVVFSWSSSRRESFPTILYLLKLRTSLSQRRVCRRWRLLY